jgi:hypothetical protein
VKHQTPAPAESCVAALLAFFALAPDAAVGAHAGAAVLALAPSAVMLADAGAHAVLVGASDAVIRCPCPCSTRGYARRCRRPRIPARVPLALRRALLASPLLFAHPVPLGDDNWILFVKRQMAKP